jgi:hypothetical protein
LSSSSLVGTTFGCGGPNGWRAFHAMGFAFLCRQPVPVDADRLLSDDPHAFGSGSTGAFLTGTAGFWPWFIGCLGRRISVAVAPAGSSIFDMGGSGASTWGALSDFLLTPDDFLAAAPVRAMALPRNASAASSLAAEGLTLLVPTSRPKLPPQANQLRRGSGTRPLSFQQRGFQGINLTPGSRTPSASPCPHRKRPTLSLARHRRNSRLGSYPGNMHLTPSSCRPATRQRLPGTASRHSICARHKPVPCLACSSHAKSLPLRLRFRWRSWSARWQLLP